MDLSRSVSEINGDFSRKSQIFLTPALLLKGFPLELGICAWGQKARVMGLPDGRSLTTVDTVRQRDRRTDRQNATFPMTLTES